MMIPHAMLSPDALRGLIEAFVTREGTDYGLQDIPLATKVFQVQQQLDAGTAVIVYDAGSVGDALLCGDRVVAWRRLRRVRL
jgi:uncharacterized protein YheU (UPF0270 family)